MRNPTRTDIATALKHWAALYSPPDKTKPRDLGRVDVALKSDYETKSSTAPQRCEDMPGIMGGDA